MRDEDEGLVPLLVGDGRSLLILTGLALLFSGGFALFLAARREFLPHDIRYLGMSADALCALGGCRVAAFMFTTASRSVGRCSRSAHCTYGLRPSRSVAENRGRGGHSSSAAPPVS